jgi:hypothetical protein
MEGTAMWMEGQVYPTVLDRIGYLRQSALSRPGVPLDTGTGGFEYGSWLFWRFLTEKVFGNDPTIIRDIWERADGSSTAAFGDEYSFQAVRRALSARGQSFGNIFARFGRTNDLRDYSEAGLGYPVAPVAHVFSLGSKTSSTGWQAPRLNHLASRFYRFRPAKSVKAHAKLHLRVDLPGAATNAAASVVIYPKGGPPRVGTVSLGTNGIGSRAIDFGRAEVRKVDLVLSNGSLRFDCRPKDFPETFYSCGGFPLDDFRAFRFRARL